MRWFDGFFNTMTTKLVSQMPSDPALASLAEVILRMALSAAL